MTDSNSRPASDASGDQTIPLVPESGYAATEQWPLPEETRVEPVAEASPWASDAAADLSAPGYGAGYGQPSAGGQPQQSNYTQPQAYGSGYSQPQAYGSGYSQPQAFPTAQPQPVPQPLPQPAQPQSGTYREPRFAEPAGPAESIGSTNLYQGYPTAPYAQQQSWPAVIQDPVNYDYGYARQPAASEHPNATMSLILGIVGVAFFQVLSPVAWYLAAKGRREMAAFPGRWRPSGSLTAGLVLGIIGTVFLGLAAAFILMMILIAFGASA